ncbi:MAG: hypothetical protein KatS3mg122_0425 [Caldimonas sp.]|uniref:esterase/lipase family protein n=1 Tax=Caldimonas manganoxidans TaxID=196015 RepID=UPI0003670A8E|nr:hypothetical protein [Caldimonas manganoxidans]GIX23194.1 MAG: hypothetical protein KatS3mg122_0425 [Caldimonas sp.]
MACAVDLEFELDGDVWPQGPSGLHAKAGRRPIVQRVEGRLNARELLDRFRAVRDQWYSPQLARFVEGIERQLEHELRMSQDGERLAASGPAPASPGAPSPAPQAAALTQRLHLWHPDVWWMAPLVRRQDTPLNMRLPLADNAQALVQELAEQLPAAWRRRRVTVQLEVETHVYWGGCGLRDPDGDGPEIWSPCSFRGDGVGASEDILQFKRGKVRWLVPVEEAAAVRVRRTLRPGVGLLVAVPIISFERQEGSIGWCLRLAQRLLRRLGWKRPWVDRDPTFERRLRSDEAYWAQALGMPLPTEAELAQAVKTGARLAPASRPATAHRPPAQAGVTMAHVVLLHGGLTSARSSWAAWLPEDPSAASAGLWRGLPMLDGHCVWRFEHDTFLRVARNVDQLVDALERQVLGAAERGTLVLLAHSRGGNVARFALPRLRQRWPQWTICALTAGSPHLGTMVFRQIGRRWAGLSVLLGVFRDVASDVLDARQNTDLLILERALAYDIPPGFKDVEPSGVARMAKDQSWPEGLIAWGSQWAPERGLPLDGRFWHRLVEDLGGLEADGDGIVPLHSSAPQGLPEVYDASPVFHTGYFAHPPTVAQIRAALQRALSVAGGG